MSFKLPRSRPGSGARGQAPGRCGREAISGRPAREKVDSQWLPAHRPVHVRWARCPGRCVSPASAAAVFARAVARGLRAPLFPGAWGPARPAAGRECRSEHSSSVQRREVTFRKPHSFPQRPHVPLPSSHLPPRLTLVGPGVRWGRLALCDFLSQRI